MHVPVAVVGLMLSWVLCGPEKPKPAAKDPPIPREELRYDGKGFEQWRRALLTELKPERRLEALTALKAFAGKGYGAEAAAVSIDLMMEYAPAVQQGPADPGAIANAAAEVIDQAGVAAQPALFQALQGPTNNRKRFALSVLASRYPEKGGFEAMSGALKDEDAGFRSAVLYEISELPWKADDALIRLVQSAMRDKTESVRVSAARCLGKLASNPQSYAAGERRDRAARNLALILDGTKSSPGLLSALKDPSPRVRIQAIESLEEYLSSSPEVGRAVDTARTDADPEVRKAAAKALTTADGN